MCARHAREYGRQKPFPQDEEFSKKIIDSVEARAYKTINPVEMECPHARLPKPIKNLLTICELPDPYPHLPGPDSRWGGMRMPRNRELPALDDSDGSGRLPLSQLALKAPTLHAFYQPEISADGARLRRIVDEAKPNTDRLISAGTIYRGRIRTFSGGLAHENGRYSSRKAKRLLHWEGKAQRALLVRSESDYRYTNIDTECLKIDTSDGVKRYVHIIDVLLTRPDGTELAIEVKRDEHDLECPEIRAKYAATAEVLRRIGIDFEIVFRDEIFLSRHHRFNAELFASRAFVHVSRKHVDRMENLALRHGAASTYGALADALEPNAPVIGTAILQALAVRRRVQIDITKPLTSNTPLTIH